MPIEFEVWPSDAVPRLTRLVSVMRRFGLPVSVARPLLLEIVALYEDISSGDADPLIDEVLERSQTGIGVQYEGVASCEPTVQSFAAMVEALGPSAVGLLRGGTPPRSEMLWPTAMHLALDLVPLDADGAATVYAWAIRTFPDNDEVEYARLRLRQLGRGPSGATPNRTPSKSTVAQNRPRLLIGLEDLGYRRTLRSPRVFRHPNYSDRRLVVTKQVVRFETITKKEYAPWRLEISYRISRQVDEALAAADPFSRGWSPTQSAWR